MKRKSVKLKVKAHKKLDTFFKSRERAHFYTISGEMVCALCEAPPKLAFRLLRRCRSVQGADAPCAAYAAIPFSNGRFPGTVGDSPSAGKTEYRFLHKTVCRVSR